MATISKPTTFVDGTVPTAAQFNGDFDTIYNEFNGSISNSNISASAAIAATKISGTAATLGDANVYTAKQTFLNTVQTVTTVTDAATVTFNLNLGNVFKVTLGGNRTLAISNASVGQFFKIDLIQDGTGSRTVTWFSTLKWPGGAAPTLSTAASAIDSFVFEVTSAGNYQGYIVGQNLS